VDHRPDRSDDDPRRDSAGREDPALEADVVICEADSCKDRCSICRCRRSARRVAIRATSTWPARRRRASRFSAPGRNADGVAELALHCSRREPTRVAADADVRQGRVQKTARSPTKIPRLAARRSYRRPGRSRCGRARHEVAAGRNRHAGHPSTRSPEATRDSLDTLLESPT
jgi:hypothetical protein